MPDYHIAQVNIARLIAPIDSATLAEFVANLDPINALADNAEGFVWRLQSEEGDATSIRVFDDDMLLINMSVWESIEALHNYVYKSDHAPFIKRRKEWFNKMQSHHMAMWWIPAGHIPTAQEAKDKLEHLDQHGATPNAFTFAKQSTVDEWLAVLT